MTEETTTDQTADVNGDDPSNGIALFNRTDEALAVLQERLKDRVYDIATVKGMDEAKKDRAELRTLRVNLDKMRKSLNEDDQARIKARNTRAGEITAKIEALEDPIDEQIKAEETRKAEIRAEREREEQQRLASITAEIGNIQRMPLNAVGADAEELQLAIDNLVANTLEQFDDVHLPTAQQAKDEALTVLNRMLAERRSLDEQQAAIDAQKAEQAQREAEAAEAQAERDREAEAQRKQEEADRAARALVDEHIADLWAIPSRAGKLDTEALEAALTETQEIISNHPRFGDRQEDAKAAIDSVVQTLTGMLHNKREADRIAAEQATRQAALDAQEATAAAERAERERIEAEQREADAQREREAQAERDRLAEEERKQAEADRLAAEEDARKARIENATLRSAAMFTLDAIHNGDLQGVNPTADEATAMLEAALAADQGEQA